MIELVGSMPSANSLARMRRLRALPDRQDMMARGLRDTAGLDVPTPIVDPLRGELLALACAEGPLSNRIAYITDPGLIRELYAVGIPNYDDLWSQASNGAKFDLKFVKTATTNPVAGQYMDLWPVGGDPTAGAYGGAAATAVQKSDATTGALQHGGNVSTDTKHVVNAVAAFSAGATAPTLVLYDRVLTYEACAFTAGTSQAMTNGVAAQRYIGSTAEGGLKIMFTCQTVFGATASNLTVLTYVNQAGTGGQTMPTTITATIIVSVAAPTSTLGARVACPATGTTPYSPFLFMAAGDTGARSITNYTTSAANTGTFCIVLARPLATFPMFAAGRSEDFDLTRGLQALPRILDGACLTFYAKMPVATGTNFEFDGAAVWS